MIAEAELLDVEERHEVRFRASGGGVIRALFAFIFMKIGSIGDDRPIKEGQAGQGKVSVSGS